MSTDTDSSDEQTTLSMKKQLLSELWNEIRRAVDIVSVVRSENESLKQNLAKATTETAKLKSQLADLEKMLTAREATSSNGFDEREKDRLIEAAKELIAKIDKQLSLF
ncbi:MAG: hypothetical protein M1470_00615 [Bacteroidetes bacterium]|nr:hypothetical protein [Bacteroidota bacterium]MCL5739107.1 hypothetical protein [Bacteroidota bacterium]